MEEDSQEEKCLWAKHLYLQLKGLAPEQKAAFDDT